ncbi:Uncharacterised protein [Vibrio cholerae]|nr:Uncharacterised protein [Vibrio cholerae]
MRLLRVQDKLISKSSVNKLPPESMLLACSNGKPQVKLVP